MPRKAGKTEKRSDQAAPEKVGQFSYQGLDRVLHEKARLGIMASLAANGKGVVFTDLKRLCALTDGNLSRHLGVLTDAGLVEVWKGTQGSRPQTMYRLTKVGRERFAEYIGVLEKIVADAQLRQHSDAAKNRSASSTGWTPA